MSAETARRPDGAGIGSTSDAKDVQGEPPRHARRARCSPRGHAAPRAFNGQRTPGQLSRPHSDPYVREPDSRDARTWAYAGSVRDAGQRGGSLRQRIGWGRRARIRVRARWEYRPASLALSVAAAAIRTA